MRAYCVKCGQPFDQTANRLATRYAYHCPRCTRALTANAAPVDDSPTVPSSFDAGSVFDAPSVPDMTPDPPPFDFGGGGGFDGGGAGRDF